MALVVILAFLVQPVVSEADTLHQELYFTTVQSNLDRASSVYAVPSGEVFIAESGRNRLLILDENGNRKDSLGTRGTGDYGFDRPSHVDATNGMRVYVADVNNRRVQIYDRRFQLLGSLRAPERTRISSIHFRPERVTVNKFGVVFVHDRDSDFILRFNQDGRFEQKFDLRTYDIDLPLSSMTHFEDTLYLAERNRGVIHMLTSGGGYLGFIPLNEPAVSLFTSERGIWVLSKNRVVKMDFNGRVIRQYRHGVSGVIKGITASSRHIYILTDRELLRAQKPD